MLNKTKQKYILFANEKMRNQHCYCIMGDRFIQLTCSDISVGNITPMILSCREECAFPCVN